MAAATPKLTRALIATTRWHRRVMECSDPAALCPSGRHESPRHVIHGNQLDSLTAIGVI
jgi:hypothetical protein